MLAATAVATTPDTMTASERFRAVMARKPVDRLPMVEWATWWDTTIDRWAGEGLSVGAGYGYNQKIRDAITRHFGLDLWLQDWANPDLSSLPEPAHHGAPRIRNLDDYQAARGRLYPDTRAGGGPWPGWKAELDAGAVGWFTLPGFFWFPRTLLGIEEHLYALADQPELIHAINEDLVRWMLQTVDRICQHGRPQFMTFAEDLSYNHGPMLSPRTFDTLLLPYYQRIIPALRERGIVAVIDSDGDVTRCLPWFAKAGIEGVLPLERQAKVDIDALQAAQPDMLFIGHFDKMTMPHGEAAMRAEFERLLPAMRRGRFIPSVDHQTPPGVSLAQYRTYLDLLREYAVRAAG